MKLVYGAVFVNAETLFFPDKEQAQKKGPLKAFWSQKMILKPHQQIAVEKIRDWFTKAPSFLLADEKGVMKTRVACTIAKDLHPCLIVAPLSTHTGWKRDAAEVGLTIDQEECVLVNYESLHKVPDDKRFVLTVWDECFPRGTKIMTQNGQKPIETISIGERVWTPLGFRKVLRTIRKTGKRKMVRLGNLVCTKNHRIWNGNFFQRADQFKSFLTVLSIYDIDKLIDYENKKLRILRRHISGIHEASKCAFLLQVMCHKASICKSSGIKGTSFKNYEETAFNGCFQRKFKEDEWTNESVSMRNFEKENIGNFEKDWASSSRQGWQRFAHPDSSGLSLQGVASGMETGISDLACRERGRTQRLAENGSGFGISGNQACRGMRWRLAFDFKKKGDRQEKGIFTFGDWMGDDEIQKQRNHAGLTICPELYSETCPVYAEPAGECEEVFNLEVEEANSYFANGVLVSNCHRLKGWKTKRAQQFLSLRHRTARSLFMSATPAQSPMDMFYLHDLCGFQAGTCGYWRWLRSWEGLHKNKWNGFQWRNCPKDQERMSMLFAGDRPYLRRLPSDIEGWPEIQRILVPVQLATKELKEAQDAFRDYVKAHGGKQVKEMFRGLIESGQLRKKLSEVKTAHTLRFVKDNLEDGYVVTVATEFLQPCHDMAKELYSSGCRVKVIDGSTPRKDREMILDASTRDELDCIVFTVMEGVNLQQMKDGHRSRIQVCHDVRWSAWQQDQVDGRTHRAGRSAPVYWMSACNTIDERVLAKLKERFDNMRTIVGDNDDFLLEVFQKEAGFEEKSESLQLEFDNISKR